MGSVVSLARLPSGGILAGTYTTLFLSTDDGNNWVQKATGLPAAPVYSISVLPTGVVYVVSEGYLYRSTDSGTNWALVSTGFDYGTLSCVGYSPTTGLFVGTWGYGILRSINDGASWFWAKSGLDNPYVQYFSFDSSGAVYAATLAWWDGHRLHRSTDNGGFWASISDGSVDAPAFACRASGTLYIGTGGTGVLRTTDYGTTWESLNTGLEVLGVSALALGGGDTMFAATAQSEGPGFYRTVDGGGHWQVMCTGISESYVRCLLQTPAGELFVGAENSGVYRSLDRAEQWTSVSTGMTGKTIRCLVSTSSGVLIVGTEGDGIFVTSDQGQTWSVPASGIGRESVWALTRDSTGHLFAGTAHGIFRSSNEGSTWTTVYTIPPEGTGAIVISLAASPDGLLYAAIRDYGLLKSTDAGLSWQSLTNAPTDKSYYPLAVTRQNVVLLGTLTGGIYRSTDAGVNWLPADSLGGVCPPSVYCLVTDVADNVFAGGRVTCPPFSSLFMSTDQGRRWGACNMTSDIYALAANSRGEVYAGSDAVGGVFSSKDAGASWEAVGPITTTALAVDPQGFLYAGGGQGNLFRTVESTTGVARRAGALPSATMLDHNYPNPFNPSTTIRYGLPQRLHVTLTVFNALGQQIAQLVNGEQEAGYHDVQFDGSGLASGVYFYRLSTNNFVQTRKLVLLR